MHRSHRSHPLSLRAFLLALAALIVHGATGVALGNGRPTATVTLTPSAPHRHHTVSAYVTTSDPDGDAVTLKYLWRLNGGVYRITESTGSTVERVYLPDVHAIEGEVISVEVTPRDAGGAGTTVSASAPVVNAPPLAGGAASALEFDGIDDYVRLPDNLFPYPPASPATSAFSFEVMFKTTGGGVILGQQASEPLVSPSDGWVPAVYVGTNGKLHATMFQHWLQPVQSPLPVNDGNWHHVAVTFDGSNETVYLDGALLESRPAGQGGYASTYRYQLGVGNTMYWANDNGGWYHFNGSLDEVRVWNRARTAGEVVGWKNGPLVEADPALLAYYKLDEGGGTVANDGSGAGRHGALINGPVWRATGTRGIGIPSNSSIGATEDADYQGALPGSDNGYQQTITFSAVRQPTHGVLYLQANGQFFYSPTPNYRGSDSFTYRTHDGTTFGNTALVSVNVQSINDAPRFDQLLNVIMGVNVQRTLQISGIDSGAPNEQQALSITATSDNPAVVPHPSVSYSSPSTTGSLTFAPTALGTANITVTLNDGGSENATFTRTFQVTVQSDVPSLEVTTLQDSSVGGDGLVSLREAVAYAATLSGSPIVTFAPGVTGTITLGSQLTVNHNMTIAGPGAKLLAVDGNAASRIFNVTAGNTVTIQDLTIRNGKALGTDATNTHGGGIYNAGTLSLFRCAITGNRGEGSSTGGGIFNSGTLTMVGCTVANNWSSDAGGGLRHNAGTANLTNCTFADNEGASAGGVQVFAGTANVRHCTIAYNNSRESGTGRAGGIQTGSGATLNFNNSITSGNTRAGVLGGDFNSFSAGSSANAIGATARLGVLRDNGGPTQTIAPLSGSNAIDAALADGTSTDQRGEGFTRTFDHASVANRNGSSGSDCGAYEVQRGELATANDQDVVALMAVAKSITLAGSVDDNSTPTFAIVSQPAHGTLTAISGNQLTYTSHAGYTGADSFTFRAETGGGATSNIATVRINVIPSNRAPVAIGTGVQDNFNDNSLDGAKWQTYYPLAGSLVTEENGAISLKRRGYLNTAAQFKPSAANPLRVTGRFTFGPTNDNLQVLTRSNGVNANNNAGTTGETSHGIEFGAFQSGGYIAIFQRSNSVPTTLASAPMTLAVNQTYTFEINDDGSAVSMTVTNAANPSVTSTVNATNGTAFGTNRVTFHNSDGVNIVLKLDDVVISTTGGLAVTEDTPASGYVVATDPDGDALTYTRVDGPAHGTLSLSAAGAFTYTPDAEYSGPDSFRFRANDGALDSNIATVTMNVAATNDPPIAANQSVSTFQNTSHTITLGASDAEGDALTYTIVAAPAHGTLGTISGSQVTYTPSGGYFGNDSFTFRANDGAANSNVATVSITVPEPLYVTINQAADQADPTNNGTIHFTAVFSQPVANFATGDVTLSGDAGATTATVSGSGTTYDVAVTGMTSSGSVIASIAANVASDAAGNPNAASSSTDNTVSYDNSAPSVTINQAGDTTDPTKAGTLNFTVVFSEAVANFATGDVTLSGTAGATSAVVTGSGTTYNVAVTGMASDGTVIASIAAGAATDAAGNANSASSSTDNSVTYDTTAPSVTINQAADQADPARGSSVRFTVRFSEPVAGFAAEDVTLSGTAGAANRSVTGAGTTYEVAVSGMSTDGSIVATVASGAATDLAGNSSAASTSTDNSVGYDNTAPTVAIEQAAGVADPTHTTPINFTVVFSESVADFATGDVTLSGTAGAANAVVTGSGTTYNVAVSGMTSDGTTIASIAAAVATDAAGNPNAASTSIDNSVTYDATAPTVTINQADSQADPTNASAINFTVVFSETVTDFATGDVTLSGTAGATTATVTGSGTTYNVAVSGGTNDGTVLASIAAGAASDAAGNQNAASTSTDNSVTYDATAPTVTINQAAGQSDPTTSSTINFTVVFSEPVADFTTGDVTLSGMAGATTATVTGSGTTYSVAVSGMTANGTVVATIAADAAHDLAGNGNIASSSTDNSVTYIGLDLANSYEVNSTADTTDGVCAPAGGCTLRDAITAANNDAGAETITFNIPTSDTGYNATTGVYTITLTAGQLVVTDSVAINGPGANALTVSGNNASRILSLNAPVTISISGVTLTGGKIAGSGGAIQVNNSGATLSVTGVTVAGNEATSFGGGLHVMSSAAVNISDSTFANNVAGVGGAVRTQAGTLTIRNSTFSGNEAISPGTTTGGAIRVSGGTANITNSTFTLNRAAAKAGGIVAAAGATVNIGNTIVAANVDSESGAGPDVHGAFTSQGNNLIGHIGFATGFTHGTNGDKVGSSSAVVDAKLAAITGNGGATPTHLPLPGSPAIHAGSNTLATNATLTTDARGAGFPRVVNATVDIGAVETNYSLAAAAGTPQSATINTAFAAELKATVTESGLPKSGIAVDFTAPSSGAGATFDSNSVVTNSDGIAATVATANGIAGTYIVSAALAGGSPASNFDLTNTKGTAQVVLGNLVQAYDGSARPVTVTVTPAGLAVSITYDGDSSAPIVPGSYQVVATVTDANYDGTASGTLTVEKAAQTITFEALSDKTYGASDFTVAANASSTLPVTFSAAGDCTISGNTVHITSAGVCTITASQSGDSNYQPAAAVARSFNINKAPTSASLSSSANPSDFGQTVTFTATVASAVGTPPGSVQFQIDGADAGAPVALTAGVASYSTSSLPAGTHAITAVYSGETNFTATSATLPNGQVVKSPPEFTIGDLAIGETNAGVSNATFTVALTSASNLTASVEFITANGSAIAPSDYEATSGTLTFDPGQTTKTISIPIKGDAVHETDETFAVTLANPQNATIARATGTGTIRNDDAAPTVQFAAGSYTRNEDAGTVALTLTKTGATELNATVRYATSDGTASAPSDYTATVAEVTFAPAEMSKEITVAITDDTVFEPAENFSVTLSNPSGATLGTVLSATVTIADGDPEPTPTPSPTATPTPTASPTASPTATPGPSASPTPSATPSAQARNISTRLHVMTGDHVMIAGFIITGNEPKPIVLRGMGPSLSYSGVSAVLADPVLELHGADGTLITTNDNWRDAQQAQIEGTSFEPGDERESVIMITLPPGSYTAVLSGKAQTAGVGLVEVYDASAAADARLANISTRGYVTSGEDVMIGGFILGEGNNTRLVVRALGASLAQAGLQDSLADPTLDLRDSNGERLAYNDDWQNDPEQAAQIGAAGVVPTDPREAALAVTLPPGDYTVIVADRDGGVGVALVEIYNLQ